MIAERMLGVGAGKLTCQVFLFFFSPKKIFNSESAK